MKRFAKALFVFAVAVLALGIAVTLGQGLPDGPVPVAWDEEACAECRMHVGNPAYAAQLQTRDGDVLNFDDPGCLLRYRATRHPKVHAVYFHAQQGERWLRESEVAFVRADDTPMGYGLAAVPRRTTGAVSLRQAAKMVAARRSP